MNFVDISTCGSSVINGLSVGTSAGEDDLVCEIFGAVWPCQSGTASIGLPVTPGTPIYITVDDENGEFWPGLASGRVYLELSEYANTTPLEEIPTGTGCVAPYCSSTGGSPSTLTMTYNIPASSFPIDDDGEGSCFWISGGGGNDLVIAIDIPGGSQYSSITANTCTSTASDSAIALFDDAALTNEIACSEDALGEDSTYCSKISDSVGGLPPNPFTLPTAIKLSGGTLYLVIDEYMADSYWSGATNRIIEVELIP